MAEITSAGFRARTEVEIRDRIRARLEARVGVAINWANVGVIGELVDIMASEIADESSGTASVVDALSLQNATGIWLAAFGQLRNIYPSAGSASSAKVTITAWARSSVSIPAGYRMVAQGDGDSTAGDVWVLQADLTLAPSASATVAVASEEKGIYALGSGDTLVGAPTAGVQGVATIVYASDYSAGVAADTEASFRDRLMSRPLGGSHSPLSLRAQLESLDGVEFAHVISNTGVTYLYEGAIAVPPGAAAVIVHPSTSVASEREAIATVILDNLVAGTSFKAPTATGSEGVRMRTTGPDGQSLDIGWYWSTPKTQNVTVVLSNYLSGYELADVQDAVEAAIQAYFDGLRIGQSYSVLDLYAALAAVEGFQTAVISGSALVTCEPYEYFVPGTVTVT
jgi:uncharacterized phage protein gp47/JayE